MPKLTDVFNNLAAVNQALPVYLQEILDKLPAAAAALPPGKDTLLALFPLTPGAQTRDSWEEHYAVMYAFKKELAKLNADVHMGGWDGANGAFKYVAIVVNGGNTLDLAEQASMTPAATYGEHMEQLQEHFRRDFYRNFELNQNFDSIGMHYYLGIAKGMDPFTMPLGTMEYANGQPVTSYPAAAARTQYWDVNAHWAKPAPKTNPGANPGAPNVP